ncbi:MAG: SnoaL-like domain [Thermoleophilaceae bacterium]|jgi:ketosteroid isomerase-like protein|nr:SnoaL-like domain [Thermoleophilaceae bacterium]
MSQENVETFRALLRAVAQFDAEGLVGLTDPDVEWHSFFAALLPSGSYTGHQGMRNYVADLRESWESIDPQADQTLDTGNIVVGIGQVVYRGKGSGVASEAAAGWVMTFRAGKVLSFRAFRNPDEAFEAMGLSE